MSDETIALMSIYKHPDLGVVSIYPGRPPFKGRFQVPLIEASVNAVKGYIIFAIFLLTKTPLPLLLWIPSFRDKLFVKFGEQVDKVIFRLNIPDEHLCRSNLEFIRAADVSVKNRVKRPFFYAVFRRTFTLIYEFDDAYRFRIQDIVACLDKKLLIENPRKEIKRLLDIAISREGYPDIIKKYQLIKRVFTFFPRNYLNILRDILLEVTISQVALDNDDWRWASYKHYDFGGYHCVGGRYAMEHNLTLEYNLLYNPLMNDITDAEPELRKRIDDFIKEYYMPAKEECEIDYEVQINGSTSGFKPVITLLDTKKEPSTFDKRSTDFQNRVKPGWEKYSLSFLAKLKINEDGITPTFTFVDGLSKVKK